MARETRKFGRILIMKKNSRWVILATFGALALLLGAPLYHRYKVVGEEVVNVEIYYYSAAPLGAPSNKSVLKYQASGEKAERVWQQLQLDPSYQIFTNPSFWMSDFYIVRIIRRNGRKSNVYLDIVSNRAWPSGHGMERRLTPQSLHDFRALLTNKISASQITKKPSKP